MVEITAAQAAKILEVDKRTVHNYAGRGLINARKQGLNHKYLFELDDVIRFATDHGYRIDAAKVFDLVSELKT